jgi:hypothetical protein
VSPTLARASSRFQRRNWPRSPENAITIARRPPMWIPVLRPGPFASTAALSYRKHGHFSGDSLPFMWWRVNTASARHGQSGSHSCF